MRRIFSKRMKLIFTLILVSGLVVTTSPILIQFCEENSFYVLNDLDAVYHSEVSSICENRNEFIESRISYNKRPTAKMSEKGYTNIFNYLSLYLSDDRPKSIT